MDKHLCLLINNQSHIVQNVLFSILSSFEGRGVLPSMLSHTLLYTYIFCILVSAVMLKQLSSVLLSLPVYCCGRFNFE